MAIAYEPARDRVVGAVASTAPAWVNRYPMADESFGEVLRKWRDRKGLSQEAFADAVGLSRKTIYSIENERGRPRIDDEVRVVTKMAEILEVPVVVLSCKLDWMPCEKIDWEAGLLLDPRLDDETRQALAQVIRRIIPTTVRKG